VTEHEWLACTDPAVMAHFLCDKLRLSRRPAGRRRLRLYACACCRRVWDRLSDDRSRAAVEVAERYADGAALKSELDRVWGGRGRSGFPCDAVCDQIGRAVAQCSFEASSLQMTAADGGMTASYREIEAEQGVQAALLRDIFGNPYRPVAPDPAWVPSNAEVLAQAMYDSRDFAAMPLLADLLEEAGCPAAVSEHCRGPGPHVRGCWVVDLLLGKG
jgi:hypothetical protein